MSLPSSLEILILAVAASAFWPMLILIVVLALRLEQPIRVLWFLAGGFLTTATLGIVIVFALQDTSFVSRSHPPANPTFALVAGLLSLLVAYALLRSSRRVPPPGPATENEAACSSTSTRG